MTECGVICWCEDILRFGTGLINNMYSGCYEITDRQDENTMCIDDLILSVT